MITQDCKHPRELLTLAVSSSRLWHKIQILISFVFYNLALVALLPYLLDIFSINSTNLFLIILLLFNFFLVLGLKRFCLFTPARYEISCKHGVWKLTQAGRVEYAQLIGDILVWQWIIIIHLKLPAKPFKLIILKDSMAQQDMASFRRWLESEFN